MLAPRALLYPIIRKNFYFTTKALQISMAHWSATCLSSESSDTNLSILVDSNASRYIFNCGEGTTRTLLQRRKGFRKITALFTTGINTDRSSGLPGLLMTIADSGCLNVNVFGPLGLNHFLASTRLYTMRESLSLKPHEILTTSTSPVYTDVNLSVFAIPAFPEIEEGFSTNRSVPNALRRKNTSDSDPSDPPSKKQKVAVGIGDIDGGPIDKPTSQILHSEMWSSPSIFPPDLTGKNAVLWRQLVIQHVFPGKSAPATPNPSSSALTPPFLAHEPFGRKNLSDLTQINKPLPHMTREPCALTYILVGAQGRGKFDAAKASALGLQNGPLRGRLAKGETVVTPTGTTITPDMVLGPAPQPDVMIIIDCPSPRYIPSLTSSQAFLKYQHGGQYPAHCIFHLVGPKVLDDSRYRQWLKEFGDKVHHLIAGPDITPDQIAFTSSAYAQLRLSHLDPEIFRVPKYLPAPTRDFKDVSVAIEKIEMLKNNHYVSMKPAKAPVLPSEDDGIDLFHPAVKKGGEHNISSLLKPKTIEAFREARQLVADQCLGRKPQPGDHVMVTPFGTSSAMPSKYRNVSALLIQIPGSGSILLDCGEGTMGQLRRQFGEHAYSVLRDIRCIFISHIHGDHHIGLSKLLSQRRKMDPPCTSPIYLIMNKNTYMYLREYSDLEDLGLDDPGTGVRVVYSEHAHWRWRSSQAADRIKDSSDEWKEVRDSHASIYDLKSVINLTHIATVDVWHRGRCYGIVIKHQEGWSIVYSGDTRPTDNLVRAGQNATLLIHEATLGDDQTELAAIKAHSTIGQALDIAKRMKAKNLLLTHFSNRFPKTPQTITGSGEATDPTIAIAFDHATVSIGNLWKLNRYLPAIEQSFLDSEDPEDEVVLAREAP